MNASFLMAASDALCPALLHSLWQGALAAAAFWIVLRKRWWNAKVRHDFGCVLLALLPLLAIATFARKLAALSHPVADIPGNLGAAIPLADLSAAHAAASTNPGSLAWAWPLWANSVVAILWLAGSSTLLSRSVIGLWATRRLAAQTTLPLPDDLQTAASQMMRDMDLPRATRVIACAGAVVPYTYGWLAPVVVMPMTAIAGLDATHLQLLLRHELAHVLRRDFVFNALQNAAESLLFYHPLVWWLSARVRAEREAACDEAVLEQGVDKLGYAKALASLESLRHEVPSPALGAHGGDLKMRIRSILHSGPRRSGASWGHLAIVGGLGLAGILVACSFDALEPDSPAETVASASAHTALSIAWLPPDVARHRSEIERASRAHGVDPNLMALMVLVESGGNPRARSPMGSLGLMQLMPSTARGVAERAGLTARSDDALYEVPLNLDLGARLLAELFRQFAHADADVRLHNALSAYNAGTKAVRAHLQSNAPLPDETVRYVALLESLYRERSDPESPAYEAWRDRVVKRATRAAVPPVLEGRLTSAFGPRVHPIDHDGSFHEGVDIAQRPGTSVRTPLAGVVIEAGDSGDARGSYVVVRHGTQLETRYHHLASVAVKPGQALNAGDELGAVGNTGKSTGAHLHFELRDQGRTVDPKRVLGGL